MRNPQGYRRADGSPYPEGREYYRSIRDLEDVNPGDLPSIYLLQNPLDEFMAILKEYGDVRGEWENACDPFSPTGGPQYLERYADVRAKFEAALEKLIDQRVEEKVEARVEAAVASLREELHQVAELAQAAAFRDRFRPKSGGVKREPEQRLVGPKPRSLRDKLRKTEQ